MIVIFAHFAPLRETPPDRTKANGSCQSPLLDFFHDAKLTVRGARK